MRFIIRDITTPDTAGFVTFHLEDCDQLNPDVVLPFSGAKITEIRIEEFDIESAEGVYRRRSSIPFETRRHTCINAHLNRIDVLPTIPQLADQLRVPPAWLRDRVDELEAEDEIYSPYGEGLSERKLTEGAVYELTRIVDGHRNP
jgi:hypothetical protein